MMQTSLAEVLRVLRARKGYSLAEAAQRAHVTPETLSDLEKGKRKPYMPTLSRIARGYDVPVETLLSESTPEGEALPKVEALPDLLSPENEQRFLEEMGKKLDQAGTATRYLALPTDRFEALWEG